MQRESSVLSPCSTYRKWNGLDRFWTTWKSTKSLKQHSAVRYRNFLYDVFFIMQKALLMPTGSPNSRKLESIRFKVRHNEFRTTSFTLGVDEHVLLAFCKVSLLEGRRQYQLNWELKRSVQEACTSIDRNQLNRLVETLPENNFQILYYQEIYYELLKIKFSLTFCYLSYDFGTIIFGYLF